MSHVFTAPGMYVQGPDELLHLSTHAGRFGSHALVITTEAGMRRVAEKVRRGFEGSPVSLELATYAGECCHTEVDRLCDVARTHGCDVIVGIGGGKDLDTAKAVAYQLVAPVVVCPTIVSSDAPCSALSVIYHDDGSFDSYLHLRSNPDVVLMDTTVIVASPVRLSVAGMGDALSTYFEARAVLRSGADTSAGARPTRSALALARLCYETLLSDGAAAKAALESGLCTEAVDHVIEANTLMSGIGFEGGGLAAAHAVANGLTTLDEAHVSMHGEKVAFGTLCQLVLEDASSEDLDEVMGFCAQVGLPACLHDLGVDQDVPEKAAAVAEASCRLTDTMANMPFEVTPPMVRDAILRADGLGRSLSGLD
jgi:glycerol dehydrogenase